MAAGTAKPIVPSPPELIQLFGRSYCTNCAAHIWCWPTPATKIDSGPEMAPMRSMTCCGATESTSEAA